MLLYEMRQHVNICSTCCVLYVSLICNKQFLIVEILSKGTWLVSFALNLSANNCFSTYFSYVDPTALSAVERSRGISRWGLNQLNTISFQFTVQWVKVSRSCTDEEFSPLLKLVVVLMLWRPYTLIFVLSTMRSINAATGILLRYALNSI